MTSNDFSPVTAFRMIEGTRSFVPSAYVRNAIINAYQVREMRKLVRHAFHKSEFYRNLYTENGIRAKDISSLQFKDLPIISKKEMTENFDRIVTDHTLNSQKVYDWIYNQNSKENGINKTHICFSTSGSLAAKMLVVYSAHEWQTLMTNYSLYTFRPNQLKNKKIKIAGILRADGTTAGITVFRSLPKEEYDIKELSLLMPLEDMIAELNAFQPDYVFAYPGVFLSLLPYQKNGTLKISPQVLGFGGEILTEEEQKEIVGVFKAHAANTYGASECLLMGSKGPNDAYFKLFPQCAKIEVVNDQNEHVKDGETGRVIVTNLFNYTQPFLRYAIGDIARFGYTSRGEPCIQSIVARNYKSVYFNNNLGEKAYFHPFVLSEIFSSLPEVQKTQFVLGDNHLTIRLVSNEQGITKAEKKLVNFLREKNLDQSVKFAMEQVETLKPELNGKIPFIKYDTTQTA